MEAFGSFEVRGKAYSDSKCILYHALKVGESKAKRYLVKLFLFRRVGSRTERLRLRGIELQKTAASASAFICPVLESGQDSRGVWYVTPDLPRSVQKILFGRVELPSEALHHILLSVVQGALDLQQNCGRSHGEIRPTNVLISGCDHLTEAQVQLCDPCGTESATPEEIERADLNAIGKMLLSFVNPSMADVEDAFLILPILVSDEWRRVFGKDADAWLELCNRLLDPSLSLESMSLEKLRARLHALRTLGGARFAGVFLAGAAAVGVLGAAAFWVWRKQHP